MHLLLLLTYVHVSGSQSILLAMKEWLQEGRSCVQAQQAVDGLKVTGDKTAAKEQIKALYKTFTDSDCTMVEVCSASTTHQSGFAQCDPHMAPVWQRSTSFPWQHPLSIQLSQLAIGSGSSGWQD